VCVLRRGRGRDTIFVFLRRWRSLQRSPKISRLYLRGPACVKGEGRGKRGGKWREGKGKKREGKWMGHPPKKYFVLDPPMLCFILSNI